MQPLSFYLSATSRLPQEIRSTKHRTSSKVRRVYRDNPRIFTITLSEVLGHGFCMSEGVVHANEGGGDVGLLVQVGEAETR
jgi:hypothetical protein